MKPISLLISIVLLIAFFGCAANETTGVITLQNRTDKSATNVKIGSIYVGNVVAGQVVTAYFFNDESNAEISAGGFSPTSGAGKITLKQNYIYELVFDKFDVAGYRFYIEGYKVGGKSTDKVGMN